MKIVMLTFLNIKGYMKHTAANVQAITLFSFREKGNTTMNQRPHTEQLMLGIRTHDLRSRGCGEEKWDFTGRNISPVRGLPKSISHERHVCYNSDFTNMHLRIAFLWFLHSWHSFLWISSQRESHSSDITRGFHSASSSLTIPPIFGSERKGIPDDDSKATAAKGNSLHICFYVCACLLGAYHCVHYLPKLRMGVKICREFKMVMWLLNNSPCVYLYRKSGMQSLSIYNLLHLAATIVKNALRWTCMLLISSLFCP